MLFKVDVGIIFPISILNILNNTTCCDFLTKVVFSESLSLASHLCNNGKFSLTMNLGLNFEEKLLKMCLF